MVLKKAVVSYFLLKFFLTGKLRYAKLEKEEMNLILILTCHPLLEDSSGLLIPSKCLTNALALSIEERSIVCVAVHWLFYILFLFFLI